jgi:quinol monooxygenase YgiN
MRKKVVLNVGLTIHEGKIHAFQTIAREMVEASRKEPGTLGYEWYLSGDSKRCQLIETYNDANALLGHLTGPAVKEGVPKILTIASVSCFQVYGEPGPKAKEILAGFGAEIFSYSLGLSG